MSRTANRTGIEWETPKEEFRWEHVTIEILMDVRSELRKLKDVRRELRKLNQLLHCTNFLSIPGFLRQIELNTTRKKRRK